MLERSDREQVIVDLRIDLQVADQHVGRRPADPVLDREPGRNDVPISFDHRSAWSADDTKRLILVSLEESRFENRFVRHGDHEFDARVAEISK